MKDRPIFWQQKWAPDQSWGEMRGWLDRVLVFVRVPSLCWHLAFTGVLQIKVACLFKRGWHWEP